MGPSDAWKQREQKVGKVGVEGVEGVMTGWQREEEGEGKAEEKEVAAVAGGTVGGWVGGV